MEFLDNENGLGKGQRNTARTPIELLLVGPRQVEHAQRVKAIGRITGILTEKATVHASLHVTETTVEYTNYLRKPDSGISIGGESAIALGKAIRIQTGLPHICIHDVCWQRVTSSDGQWTEDHEE